jgi:putative component of toxin-antitoxin plasmid stabilization module
MSASKTSRVAWWIIGSLLLGVAGALCWLSDSPAQADWDVIPTPGEAGICVDSGDSPLVPLSIPAEDPTAFNPLSGMSLDEIKQAAQTLTPQAAALLNGVDIQFHNLYPGTTLDGPTAATSVTIQTSLCIHDMWVQFILPAQLRGGAKFGYAQKSPASVLDHLHDWVRFPFPALTGTATAGMGLDGFAEGAYPFTWVIGHGDTVLLTQDGFFAVGACCCDASCSTSGETSSPSPSLALSPLPPENPTAFNPLAGMSLDEIKSAAQTLAPQAASLAGTLDIQFHNLYPATTLDGPTAATSVTIQSNLCMEDMWAHFILPAQLKGGAKFGFAQKSPARVVDFLRDWVRFPFPAVNGTATASIGLDGFAEGVYPFTWIVGQGDTVLMTQDGFFTVGACCCGEASSTASTAPSTTLNPLAGMSLDEIKSAAQALSPEAASLAGTLDIQFHNLYPATTLSGPTAMMSVTIQSSSCLEDMWAHIILPAQLSGGAKFAHASKSPARVVDHLHNWVRFPFPAVNGMATANIGLDGFAEGVFPFTWIIGQGDTVLMTQDGFFAVGPCCCGAQVKPPTPTPVPVGECIQHSPDRFDVLMGADQTVWREVEFANICDVTLALNLGFDNPVAQITLASGHDRISLSPGERQAVRVYFATGPTVSAANTELVAASTSVEAARIPLSIEPGTTIKSSPSLSDLKGVNLLVGEAGVFSGTINNNSSVPLTITGRIPSALSDWLSVADVNPALDVSALWRQPRWELEPGDEAEIYVVLHSSSALAGTASFYLESQYGDQQEIPISVRFGPYADLEVRGSALPAKMVPGATATVAITVTNPGPSDAPQVTVPIAVNGDVSLVSITAGSGMMCTPGMTVICAAPELLVGESATVAVQIKAGDVRLSSPASMMAFLQAEILTDLYDPNTPNNIWNAIWGGSRIYLPLILHDS